MAEYKLDLGDFVEPGITCDLNERALALLSMLGSNQESNDAKRIARDYLTATWLDGFRTARELPVAAPEATSPCPRCGGLHARMT